VTALVTFYERINLDGLVKAVNFVVELINAKSPSLARRALPFDLGGDLLSHAVSRAVPSALKGLTSVFGMGTGVSPSL
jgi:uncharacterized membrane protein